MTAIDERVRAGSAADLERDGRLLTKVGAVPVVVVWHEGRAWAIEDRCPHLGFPLHQGTVEAGLLTCHWHHARFDLASGCTLDPWADDATAFDVDGRRRRRLGGPAGPTADPVGQLRRRLADGLEHGLTLVTAKATLGLLEADPSGAVGGGAPRSSSACATGPRAGGAASPCSWRWPTCCPTSTRPIGRWRSCTRSPS